MARPVWVVPRRILDARLANAAVAAGARLLRNRVCDLRQHTDAVVLDGEISAAVVVGADGAHSVIRRALGRPRGPMALALRGYAPVGPGRRGAQVIEFGTRHQPSYTWSFDRGDGLANVGYGEFLHKDRSAPTRAQLLERLEALLPGATESGRHWVGHHLPLSTARWRLSTGRVLLVGDAACLVNPLTGEGIHYAVATGITAGRAAAAALRERRPEGAGEWYARATHRILLPHLRHTALAARLARSTHVIEAGLRASAADQRVFDDFVELGLARGRLTPTVALGLGRAFLASIRPSGRPQEPACASSASAAACPSTATDRRRSPSPSPPRWSRARSTAASSSGSTATCASRPGTSCSRWRSTPGSGTSAGRTTSSSGPASSSAGARSSTRSGTPASRRPASTTSCRARCPVWPSPRSRPASQRRSGSAPTWCACPSSASAASSARPASHACTTCCAVVRTGSRC